MFRRIEIDITSHDVINADKIVVGEMR